MSNSDGYIVASSSPRSGAPPVTGPARHFLTCAARRRTGARVRASACVPSLLPSVPRADQRGDNSRVIIKKVDHVVPVDEGGGGRVAAAVLWVSPPPPPPLTTTTTTEVYQRRCRHLEQAGQQANHSVFARGGTHALSGEGREEGELACNTSAGPQSCRLAARRHARAVLAEARGHDVHQGAPGARAVQARARPLPALRPVSLESSFSPRGTFLPNLLVPSHPKEGDSGDSR
ncbi:hypothetical protein C0Q70_16049 [Pomacea canaliculata]|uniref:Uncharacterized protein n=1 Tax=Pomacea canaliculata TaxID=400727 RepID=A0A2T7NNQ7_POMCA|nr:hypothetical protein C0Q70_16049 [Pomacea canaliculata]